MRGWYLTNTTSNIKGPRFAARRKALVGLLRSLRDRGVPLHAVGLQAHLFSADHRSGWIAGRSWRRSRAQARCADHGAGRDRLRAARRFETARRDGRSFADQFLGAVADVIRPKAILTWGLTDRYTWVPTYFKRKDGMPNRPLPLDADLRRKPLFDVIDEFKHRPA